MYKINRLNIDYWLKSLTGRATCLLGTDTRLTPSARIHNIRGDNHFIKIGNHSFVAGELLVFAHGGNISIGNWCYVGEGVRIWSSESIKIGDRVLISHNVNIFDSLTHPLNAQLRHSQFREIMQKGHPQAIDLDEKPVVLENDVWIGANASLLRGVTIGEGAVIGAGSIVTHDVPPYTIFAGNPAHFIRNIAREEKNESGA